MFGIRLRLQCVSAALGRIEEVPEVGEAHQIVVVDGLLGLENGLLSKVGNLVGTSAWTGDQARLAQVDRRPTHSACLLYTSRCV